MLVGFSSGGGFTLYVSEDNPVRVVEALVDQLDFHPPGAVSWARLTQLFAHGAFFWNVAFEKRSDGCEHGVIRASLRLSQQVFEFCEDLLDGVKVR